MGTRPPSAQRAVTEIERILAAYPSRGARASLAGVERLRRLLGLIEPLPATVVVGTNGKTSVATYLQRLLTAAGTRTGLYVSPHLSNWSERVQIDGRPCELEELAATLAEVAALADGLPAAEDIRFFDLLTLGAELIFRRAGVGSAVFEAGIGGRLDAVSLLRPRLVLLTSVALDHAEILGPGLDRILTEKLLAAPPGATVLTWPLEELAATAEGVAAANGLRLVTVDPAEVERFAFPPQMPAFLRRDATLAAAGWEASSDPAASAPPSLGDIDLAVPGRFETGTCRGVPYLLDAAHNEAAWWQLAGELDWEGSEEPLVAVVSVSPGKERGAMASVLASLPRLASAIATRHTALPAVDPQVLAAELGAAGLAVEAVGDPAAAFRTALERARDLRGRVLCFGSTHLVGEVRELVQE